MIHEEKINYMKIAAGIVGYSFDTQGLDMLVSIYELVIEKQGDADLRSVSIVQDGVKYRSELKRKSELELLANKAVANK